MDALTHAKALVAFESPSYLSNREVTAYADDALQGIGFATERLDYEDEDGVPKACVVGRKGSGAGGVAYFGHTDVVPADDWMHAHGPFESTVRDGRLYGRGSCDMKGSIACMLAAAERFDASELQQPLYVACTADEEIGYGGARKVAERSAYYREMVAADSYGIIGEPTVLEVVYA
ncbi:MAG: M20/M25/M40 family metallo-hydrolase, partial [Lentisphaeria bacterium]|nr:M20/M25/M40 family metallo-hydrolase [Lentisphaeria bacterium]